MKRLLCRLFGHSWHLIDVAVECMRCGLLRPVATGAETPGSATHAGGAPVTHVISVAYRPATAGGRGSVPWSGRSTLCTSLKRARGRCSTTASGRSWT